MNGFTKKSVSTKTLGEKLQKIRSDKRISLSEASRATKIQASYLDFLEKGQYELLPADVYVRGFLRSYGDFLGVDEKIIIRLYEKERDIKKNLEKEKKPNSGISEKKPINISPFLFTPKRIILGAVILLIFLGVLFLYWEIDSFSSSPSLVVLSPQDGSEIEENFIRVEGATERDASVTLNDQPVLVDDEGKFAENITLKEGLNVLKVRAVNKFNKETSQEVKVFSSSGDDRKNEETERISLEIKIDLGPVQISVEADGELIFNGNMTSGASQFFEAKEKIVLSSEKGNATLLKFNGKDIGFLSPDAGPVKEAIFTKDTKY